jgi:hypothetical protein
MADLEAGRRRLVVEMKSWDPFDYWTYDVKPGDLPIAGETRCRARRLR